MLKMLACNFTFLFLNNKYKWNKLKAHLHICSDVWSGCGLEHQENTKDQNFLPQPPFSEAKFDYIWNIQIDKDAYYIIFSQVKF